jgi:hypothetical protein
MEEMAMETFYGWKHETNYGVIEQTRLKKPLGIRQGEQPLVTSAVVWRSTRRRGCFWRGWDYLGQALEQD